MLPEVGPKPSSMHRLHPWLSLLVLLSYRVHQLLPPKCPRRVPMGSGRLLPLAPWGCGRPHSRLRDERGDLGLKSHLFFL